MKYPCSLLLALLASQAAVAQTHTAGKTYWGANHYVEYVAGNSPVVLSSPHGGYLKPANIPNRTFGVLGQDTLSQETTRAVFDEIVRKTGRYPHMIISHLHRIKLDPNRTAGEGAQGNPIALQAWREFHGWVHTATSTVQSQWGRGHYFDMHGQVHPENWIELGYALSSSQLALSNAQLNTSTYINQSTLRAIGAQSSVNFPAILRGATSFGGLLQAAGYLTVPSPANPSPAGGNYYSGGYNVRVHSSRKGGTVDGTQFEMPTYVRSTNTERQRFARHLADAIQTVFTTHYGINPAANPRITVTATDPIAHETGDPGVFTFTRTGNLGSPAVVDFEVSGHATIGQDYSAIGTTVSFAANQATATLIVSPLDDGAAEGMETVTVHLLGGIEIGAPARASVVISDDEADPDLSAHWAMNLSTGSVVEDSSGSGHHGTIKPSVAIGPRRVTGKFLGGLLFDEGNDYVQIPGFNYGSSGDFTLSFWFNAPPSTQVGFQYMFGHGTYALPNTLNVYLAESDGSLWASLNYNNRLVSVDLLNADQDYMDSQWHHCALVATTNGLIELWVDGQMRSAIHLAGDTYTPTADILLGIRAGLSSTRYFGGRLDDVNLYQRALDPAEVQTLSISTPGRFVTFEVGCVGTNGTPSLLASGIPATGNAVSLDLTGGAGSQPATLALGASKTTWNGVPLPVDLSPLGAPGCRILTGATISIAAGTNSLGQLSQTIRFPSLGSIVGLTFYTQAWLLDPGANALGLTVSNGLDAWVGGVR